MIPNFSSASDPSSRSVSSRLLVESRKGVKMMEAEILKSICSNQGAVDTDFLLYNLCSGDSTSVSDIISNQEKFVSCHPYGQPKVVARTRLRLCRVKDCPGQCRGLHLCKNFLFSGSCHFTRQRRVCSFSHDLHSAHNERMLREHELESLNRTELCTLLMQSDDRLLPPICYDYNNGDGEFGRCQEGIACKRLHICEKYLNRECSCTRNHDFSAPQTRKNLQERAVPDNLIYSIKSVYANILALKYADRGNKGNFQQRGGNRGSRGNRGYRGSRGTRGNRGNRGNTGNQGSGQPVQRATSTSDILAAINAFYVPSTDGLNSSNSDISSAANDPDVSSDDGQKQTGNPFKTSTAVRGRGGNHGNRGNRGNHQPLNRAHSTNDLSAAVSDDANSEDGRRERKKPGKDKTEICMYFIKGHCKHEERCYKYHDKMPYRWQIRENDEWTAMPGNATIEKDYCDPKNTYSSSSSPAVHFDTMTCGSNKVRRLSTINSLLEPDFIHTTEWVWYWEDEFGKWTMYASMDGGHRAADMDSSKLEQMFMANNKDEVEFSAGSQSYSLSFQDMIQTNKRFGTKRVVRRRPRFVSAEDVQARRVRPRANLAAVPDHWDKTQVTQTGYKRVSLLRTTDEFKEIEALFCKTMKGFDIIKIERIQNKALWEVFQWQKTQMKNNNSGRMVTEKKLFHGTDSKFVDVICHTNFDWRICGTHGTAFGKGSYFARDAKYSHNYTGDSDVRSMFISRILVGHYTKGSSSYVRPPSKDGGDINFYDSCVDNVMDPSIYVVFDKLQIYPEYLLEYKTTHLFDDLFGVAVPKPVPAPKPVTAPKPAPYTTSWVSAQPSPPSYQPRTSSYQPSTPSYQPSTSSYQPSTSSYQPSTSSYRSNTSSVHLSSSSTPTRSTQSSSSSSSKGDSCVIA